MGLIAIICLFFFWGGYYLQRYSGSFSGFIYDENASINAGSRASAKPVDMLADGRRLFADTCAKCHQINGQGLPGQYPPLATSEWVVAPGPGRLIRIVLDGMQGPVQVKGETFNNPMLAWRDVLSDQQIAGLLTYVRTEKAWGNSASETTVEQVADIRQKTKNRAIIGAWTSIELLRAPEIEIPAAEDKTKK
jgi:mono/diheme cytochrome c family protein